MPVGPYVVDFVCLKARLVIEIDGAGHEDEDRDRRKTRYLESQGFRVIRIPAPETDHNLDGVIDTILYELEAIGPHPGPPQQVGRGKAIPFT